MIKVSICIPTYNSELYLEQTLNSIEGQTYLDLEVIICDNASTDKTVDIIKKYVDKYSNWHLYINKQNIGSPNNFNKLLSLATGEYVAIYHADDLYDKTIVEKSVAAFNDSSNIGLVSTMGYEINEDNKILHSINIPNSLEYNKPQNFKQIFKQILLQKPFFIITPSVMVKRHIYSKLGNFIVNDHIASAGDYEMWFRILQKYDMVFLKDKLIRYRIHEGQNSKLEIRENLNLPDVLSVYKKYAKLDYTYYQDLYENAYCKLIRTLAIECHIRAEFEKSNMHIDTISQETTKSKYSLIWLKICNTLKIKIPLQKLRKIKHLLFGAK